MGKQALLFGGALMFFAEVCGIVSIFLPMHRKSIFVLGFAKVGTMRVHTHNVDLEDLGGDPCSWLPKKICKEKDISFSLQEARERMCSPLLKSFNMSACDAFQWAFTIGLVLQIIMFLDIVCIGIAAFLSYSYLTDKPKKQYREIAMYLIQGGLIALILASIFYYGFVLHNLNQRAGQNLIGSGSADGTDIGFYIMWVAIGFKVVALILYSHGSTRLEGDYADFKDQRKYEADLAKANVLGHGHNMPKQIYPGSHDYGCSAYGSTAYNHSSAATGYGHSSVYGGHGQQFQQAPHMPLAYNTPAPPYSGPAAHYQTAQWPSAPGQTWQSQTAQWPGWNGARF